MYRTAEVANIVGIHPNTVRLYEELCLIPKPRRQANGYRVFTDFHITQLQLARMAFKVEVLQNGLRKRVVTIVKTSAARNFDEAIALTHGYLRQLQTEQQNAEEAIADVRRILSGAHEEGALCLRRKEAAERLQISVDTLRNWEMNGLLRVKRKENGYRCYTGEELRMLRVIRSLRCANYSLEAILRLLCAVTENPQANIKSALDTPHEGDEIISVCDKLITSLHCAEQNARDMLYLLESMKVNNPPL